MDGNKANTITYNLMMKIAVQRNDYRDVIELFKSMKEVRPTLCRAHRHIAGVSTSFAQALRARCCFLILNFMLTPCVLSAA